MSALSRHPDPAVATGEAIGKVLDQVSTEPEVVLLFLSAVTASAHHEIVETVTLLVRPGLLVVVTTPGVIAGSEEIEDGAADAGQFVALWAGWTKPVRWLPLQLLPGEPPVIAGLPATIEAGSTLVCFGRGDPRTLDAIGATIDGRYPGVTAVGGLGQARAAVWDPQDPGRDDASGVGCLLLGPGVEAVSLVCPTYRPLGPRWLATAVSDNLITSLDGQSPRLCVEQVIAGLDATERRLAASGLALGVLPVDEAVLGSGPEPAEVIDLLGLDRLTDAMAVAGPVRRASVVQLQVRDPDAARAEMARQLADAACLIQPTAALIFADRNAGADFYGSAGATVAMVADVTACQATAGIFTDAQLGFSNGRTRRFRSATTVVLFP